MDAKRVRPVIEAAVRAGVLGEDTPAAMFHDLDAFRGGLAALRDAFPAGTLHAVAMKANPLAALLAEARDLGFGVECASEAEVEHALRLGFKGPDVVFDSPAKTVREIDHALAHDVTVNADNLGEIERIAARIASRPSRSLVGLRVNPVVGGGTILSSSTATRTSKFGVTLDEHRAAIVDAFARHPWLVGLHAHVGSQGCALDLMAESARRLVDLADEIEARRGRAIALLDIGGGLPVDYTSDDVRPTFAEYAALLRERVSELFSGRFRLATEQGRSVFAKGGWAASRVEHVKRAGGRDIAVVHFGADLFVRTAYLPATWPHRITVHDGAGAPKEGPTSPRDIAGPLCFSGDLLAEARLLPPIEAGDFVVVHDAGAYTLGMWSRYNSRRAPAVIGYTLDPPQLRLLKPAETVDDVLRFWS
jgi:diaminopimelate decarboxylase